MRTWSRAVVALAVVVGSSTLGCASSSRQIRRPLPRPAPVARRPARGDSTSSPSASSPGGRPLGWRAYLRGLPPSESIGAPNDGELDGGVPLPPSGLGWRCKSRNSYGTAETVAILRWAFAQVARRFPGTVPVVVGDLSRRGGGRLPPHRSHRSGRDVDIGYYARDNRPLRGFERMSEATLDAAKTWYLLERLLASGRVEYIFVDYELQGALYDAARRAGWPQAALAGIFQFPRGPSVRRGIIRHARGHDDHFHVRFRCPEGDEACEP